MQLCHSKDVVLEISLLQDGLLDYASGPGNEENSWQLTRLRSAVVERVRRAASLNHGLGQAVHGVDGVEVVTLVA